MYKRRTTPPPARPNLRIRLVYRSTNPRTRPPPPWRWLMPPRSSENETCYLKGVAAARIQSASDTTKRRAEAARMRLSPRRDTPLITVASSPVPR